MNSTPASPRMSAYDTDQTQFDRSETSQRPSLDDSRQKAHDATQGAADRDLEKSPTQPNLTASEDDAQEASPPPIGSDAPDGGFRAWLVVFGAWCSSFCTWGWINGKQSPCMHALKFCAISIVADKSLCSCWCIPRILPVNSPQELFIQCSIVDPVATVLLHDGSGKCLPPSPLIQLYNDIRKC